MTEAMQRTDGRTDGRAKSSQGSLLRSASFGRSGGDFNARTHFKIALEKVSFGKGKTVLYITDVFSTPTTVSRCSDDGDGSSSSANLTFEERDFSTST